MGRGLRRIALPPFRSTGHPWLVAATVLATLAACKEAARPAPVATIAMTRALDSVYVGGTRQVGVSLTDAQGNFLTRPVNWSSNADFIATIDDDGVVPTVPEPWRFWVPGVMLLSLLDGVAEVLPWLVGSDDVLGVLWVVAGVLGLAVELGELLLGTWLVWATLMPATPTSAATAVMLRVLVKSFMGTAPLSI